MIERDYGKTIQRATEKVFPFMKKIFTGINFEGPGISFGILNDNPTMIVCSHRSHLDYMLLGQLLNRAGVTNLRYAAGDNLTNMPYIGKVFRSWGAFSVYRSRAFERTYIKELTRQIVTMLNNGEHIVVFPEGGRSYKGGMLDMKSGILAAHIIAQYQCPERTYYYYPFTVSYESFPELPYFNILEKGKNTLREKPGFLRRLLAKTNYYGADCYALAKFLLAHRLHINYGDVFVDYSEPVAINDIVDVRKTHNPAMRNEFSAHKISIQKVGYEIRRRLLVLYRVLPIHVVAACLKEKGASCTRAEARSRVADIIVSLEGMKKNVQTVSKLSEYDIIEKGIAQLESMGSVALRSDTISIKNSAVINYYAATCAE
jgi:1-acyl-sn-glycerol-3-phosphate acyltransferase